MDNSTVIYYCILHFYATYYIENIIISVKWFTTLIWQGKLHFPACKCLLIGQKPSDGMKSLTFL